MVRKWYDNSIVVGALFIRACFAVSWRSTRPEAAHCTLCPLFKVGVRHGWPRWLRITRVVGLDSGCPPRISSSPLRLTLDLFSLASCAQLLSRIKLGDATSTKHAYPRWGPPAVGRPPFWPPTAYPPQPHHSPLVPPQRPRPPRGGDSPPPHHPPAPPLAAGPPAEVREVLWRIGPAAPPREKSPP